MVPARLAAKLPQRGRAVLDRFLDNLRSGLNPGGRLSAAPAAGRPGLGHPELQDDTPGDGSMPAEDSHRRCAIAGWSGASFR